MANPLFSTLMIADFERYVTSFEYSHETHIITGGVADMQLEGLPYPVTNNAGVVTVLTAAEAAVIGAGGDGTIYGYLVTNRHEEIAAGETSMEHYAVLVRGEGVVDTDNYAAADPYDGTAYGALAIVEFNLFNATANPPLIGAANAGLTSVPE